MPEEVVVYLDRDGTINEDVGYLSRPEELRLIDGSAGAVRALNNAGARVIVISNQSGVGRGYFSAGDVDAVNAKLVSELEKSGARVDAIYFCVHHPDDGCLCRKPGTGLVEKAGAEFSLKKGARAYVVGDKTTDVELARNIGAKGVLVTTGKDRDEAARLVFRPDHIAVDLKEAVEWILADLRGP